MLLAWEKNVDCGSWMLFLLHFPPTNNELRILMACKYPGCAAHRSSGAHMVRLTEYRDLREQTLKNPILQLSPQEVLALMTEKVSTDDVHGHHTDTKRKTLFPEVRFCLEHFQEVRAYVSPAWN